MRIVKRSSVYRRNRDLISCVMPSEVWRDDVEEDTIFVLFQTRALREEYLGFAVDAQKRELLTGGVVSLVLDNGHWLGHNRALGDTTTVEPDRNDGGKR